MEEAQKQIEAEEAALAARKAALTQQLQKENDQNNKADNEAAAVKEKVKEHALREIDARLANALVEAEKMKELRLKLTLGAASSASSVILAKDRIISC